MRNTISRPIASIALGIGLALFAFNPLVHADPASIAPGNHTFSLGTDDFLLDGKPFQIIGGEMHPARIPHQYWRQRIQMAKAMGLNTIPVYVFWNQHEQEEGKFDFTTDERNIGEFLDIARQEGMWVVLRAGPYACGEWDFGGLPWWLLKNPNIKLRSSDPNFTEPVAKYFHELAKVVRPRQVENEYGSYPRRDHAYMVWLRDQWIKEGVKGPFITADGAGEHYLKGIVIPGVAVGLDPGTSEKDFALARKFNPGVPVMCTELYPGWLLHWGEKGWKPTNITAPIKFFMETHKSFSMYVFHGGTNFGFNAGANGPHQSVTSYDYAAPLNEQGNPTPAYYTYRKELASYLPTGVTLPDVPATIPTMTVAPITLARWSGIWEQLPAPIAGEVPQCFESLGQNQGMVIYRTHLSAGPARHLLMPHLRDFATVYLDGALVENKKLHDVELPAIEKEATLEVLVEGMGHINFQGAMDTDRKGLMGEVKLGDAVVTNWEMLPLPLKSEWAMSLPQTAPAAGRIGGIFKASFNLSAVADTYFDVSKYKKGVVWVNGHNLGYDWPASGPQQRLYCPAPWLNVGQNTIVILDTELTSPQPIEGFKTVSD